MIGCLVNKQHRILRLIFFALLCWSTANIAYSTYHYDWPSADERWHYNYSQRYLSTGNLERNIHNFNSTTPIVVLNCLSNTIYELLSGTSGVNKVALRFPSTLFFYLLVYGIFTLTKFISKSVSAALLSCILVMLDPSLTSHAAIIGTDVPFVAVSIWLFLSLVKYYSNPSKLGALYIGILYALAFCAKFFACFLSLPILLTFACAHFTRKRRIFDGIDLVSRLKIFVVNILIFSLTFSLLICLFYSFSGSTLNWNEAKWSSNVFVAISSYLGDLPLILPYPFYSGFDQQLYYERSMQWNVIMMNKIFPSGTWKYFLTIWSLKITLAVIALHLLAIFFFLKSPWEYIKLKFPVVLLAFTWLFLFSYLSFIFRAQVGLRYAFLCLPIAYVLISITIAKSIGKNKLNVLALAITAFALLELVPYFGNLLSFTNSIVNDKRLAYYYVVDSNLDWFQNHQSTIEVAKNRYSSKIPIDPSTISPGINAITVNKLAGVMFNWDQYKWLRENLTPIETINHTLLIYFVSEESFKKYIKDERTFEGTTEPTCSSDEFYPIKEDTKISFPGSWNEPARYYKICARVDVDTNLQINLHSGWGKIGIKKDNLCFGNNGGKDSSEYYYLKSGYHTFCGEINDTIDTTWDFSTPDNFLTAVESN